jgi:hypothetical protein
MAGPPAPRLGKTGFGSTDFFRSPVPFARENHFIRHRFPFLGAPSGGHLNNLNQIIALNGLAKTVSWSLRTFIHLV